VAPQFSRDFTHFISAELVVFSGTVREVEANNVGTGGNNLFQIIIAIRCRSESGDNFGSSEPSGHALLR